MSNLEKAELIYNIFLLISAVWLLLVISDIPSKMKASFSQYLSRRKNRREYKKILKTVKNMKNT